MQMILRYIIGLVVGLALLVWSAGLFVGSAAALSRRCGMSPLLVGMFVIGFGTSLPEMAVSAISAFRGNPGIALGNAYGSNIANILLILGLTAVLAPIAVADGARKRDLPVLCVVTAAAWLLALDGSVSRLESILMLVAFTGICAWNAAHEQLPQEDAGGADTHPVWRLAAGILVGLALVLASSMLLVWAATGLATALGVPDLIIGLTIVAVGTSLPELASSIAAISKNEHDMALGNIIGSNLFNTLAVVGIAGAVSPITGESASSVVHTLLVRDFPAVGLATLALFLFCLRFGGRQAKIDRWKGVVFLAMYACYVAILAKGALA